MGRLIGRVFQHHVNCAVEMIMADHIALPYYAKKARSRAVRPDILSATLAEELLQAC